MNIMKADCGYDPHDMDKFEDVKVDDLNDVGGFDLTSHTNMIVNLSSEDSDVSIEDFNCMKPGKVYMIVAENGASTQNELVFPASSTLYNGTITKANAMTIVYKFWTDGHSIYCDRAIYEKK